jgi:hypothetical protein
MFHSAVTWFISTAQKRVFSFYTGHTHYNVACDIAVFLFTVEEIPLLGMVAPCT